MILAADLFAQLSQAWADAVAPPRPARTPLQLAADLVVGDGPSASKPFSTPPAVRAILGALVGTHRRIVVAGPVQDGKTYTAGVVPTLYAIAEGRFSVLLAGPRKEDVDALFLDKIRPTMELSGLGDRLPQEGAGSRRGVPDQLLCPTGCSLHLRGAGGANEAQMSGITVRWVILTEADGIALSTVHARRKVSQEGRRKVELFARRVARWGELGRLIIESTVKDDRTSLILALYADSTQGRLWHECPHCHAHAPREWSQVSYDPASHASAGATAAIACPSCGVRLTPIEASEAALRALVVHQGQRIEAGRVVGEPAPVSAWGIRWTALDSPDPSKGLDLLCQEHYDATRAANTRGDWAPLRQFHRDQLVEPFTGDPAAVAACKRADTHALAARSAASAYDRGTVPWATGVVTVAIDLQEREAYWLALVQEGDRCAVVDWGEEYLCHRHETPTPTQRTAVLARVRARAERGWPDGTGAMRPAIAGGVDVGGRGWLDTVDAWLQAGGWSWYALRGDGKTDDRRIETTDDMAPSWWAEYHRDDGRRLLMVDGATIKGRIMDGLAAPLDAEVAMLLPRGVAADAWLARHLCAEERVAGPQGPVWVQIAARNDLLDCATYARALAHHASARPHAAADAVPEFV